MFQLTKPNKQQVREWLRHEIDQRRPPPDPLEIQKQLGWGMVESEYDDRCSRGFLETLM